jgi:hypothetical protein
MTLSYLPIAGTRISVRCCPGLLECTFRDIFAGHYMCRIGNGFTGDLRNCFVDPYGPDRFARLHNPDYGLKPQPI